MEYLRMLLPPKNDSLLVKMLPVIEHSVKNIENVKDSWKVWAHGASWKDEVDPVQETQVTYRKEWKQ